MKGSFFIYDMAAGHERWTSPSLVPYIKSKGYNMLGCIGRPSQKECNGYLDRSDFCMVWNGDVGAGPFLRNECRRRNMPYAAVEAAWFPQKYNYFLDRTGIIGRSNLMVDDLSWVGKHEYDKLDEIRESHIPSDFSWKGGEYIAVPLQMIADVAVWAYTPWRNMQQFVEYIRDIYPRDVKLVLRPHPREAAHIDLPFNTVFQTRGESMWDFFSQAKEVVGMTSTSLYQAALAKVPVTAMGVCPLAIHSSHTDRLLAAMADMQVPAAHTDPGYWIDKYTDIIL